jgi:hypothetical protein
MIDSCPQWSNTQPTFNESVGHILTNLIPQVGSESDSTAVTALTDRLLVFMKHIQGDA